MLFQVSGILGDRGELPNDSRRVVSYLNRQNTYATLYGTETNGMSILVLRNLPGQFALGKTDDAENLYEARRFRKPDGPPDGYISKTQVKVRWIEVRSNL